MVSYLRGDIHHEQGEKDVCRIVPAVTGWLGDLELHGNGGVGHTPFELQWMAKDITSDRVSCATIDFATKRAMRT